MANFNATTAVNKVPRQSNIEALRLLCMLMILNLHSFSGYNHGSGFLQYLDFFRETTSICAVNTFLLISGFFGIKWKFKSFFNLLFQIFFYGFGVYVAAAALGIIDFSWFGLLGNLKCPFAFWGFVKGYILLYFCAPFLNLFVEKNTTRTIFITIVVLFFAEHFFCRNWEYFNYGLVYLIGRFLNKCRCAERIKSRVSLGYWATTMIIFLLVVTFYKCGITTTAEKMCSNPLGYNYASPFVILQAIFLFLVFTKLKFQSKFINWCASSCFAIFLIHMHPSIKHIGYYAYSESLYDKPLFVHMALLLLLFFSVFFGSILVDKLRIIVSDYCYKMLCFIKKILPQNYFFLDTYLPKSINELIK